jgi:N6-adenosine-specific RNA methylase IME4
MLDADRLAALAESIRQNGQREPIMLYQGRIVDGRNRYQACQMLGVEPVLEHLPDDIDPWDYVWDLNAERRELMADQRYLIWLSWNEKSTAWKAEQQRIRDEANAGRAEAAGARPRQDDGTFQPVAEQLVPQVDTDLDRHPTRTAKAALSKTNRGTVQRMDRLVRMRPDLAGKVRRGEMAGSAAIREMRRAETVACLEDISTLQAKEADGVYDVLVIDPPWPMQKIERDERPNQSEFDYPTMAVEEIAMLKIPAADDCHVWLWTTQKWLPMAFHLLQQWSLRYVCTFVWHKPGGFQAVGLPQYNCEFALYARRGKPAFVDTKALPTAFCAPRTGHSKKPEEFYDVVRRVTAGRRLDMFNRRAIEGFDRWGNEAH